MIDHHRPSRRTLLYILLVIVILHVIASQIALHAQDIPDWRTYGALDTRVTVLENDVAQLVWWGRLVVAAVIGQIIIAIFADRRRRVEPVVRHKYERPKPQERV